MPCDGHLHTGLADIRKGGHDHLHGDGVFVGGRRESHGAGRVGHPGTPVELHIEKNQSLVLAYPEVRSRPVEVEHLSVVGRGVLSCGGKDDH